MKFMIVVAHPDDEVLGCGGTAAKWVQQGHTGKVIILGEGVTSRIQEDHSSELKLLYGHSKEATKLLGLGSPEIFDFPDNRFDSVPLLEITQLLEEKIAEFKPDRILTHNGRDLNVDHVATHRAVVTATRPMEGCPVKDVWAFEVNSNSEWNFGGQFGGFFKPQIFEDISHTLELKIKAMAIYEGEARDWPHPRSARAIRALAEHRGSTVALDAAEAFELIRQISVD